MNIKEKVFGFLTQDCLATRRRFGAADMADVFVAFAPTIIFGCLLFSWRALLVLAICVAVFLAFDYFWGFFIKKDKKSIRDVNYLVIPFGLMMGLVLNSRLHLLLVFAVSLLAAFLQKTLFKEKPMYIVAPALVARGIMSLIFFGAFSVFAVPFSDAVTHGAPLDFILKTADTAQPASYMFFGLHSGNIGETSVFLILIGGIYLMLRRIINPIIPVCFIATATVLSLCFGENLAVSLLGGGLFFAAMFMSLSYSFKTTPLYKKVLYGICCGVLTFVLRKLFKTEAAYLAVLITEAAFRIITISNIKGGWSFIKKPCFKTLLKKAEKIFWV